MDDIFGKIIVIILALILLFIVPTLSVFESQDEVSRIYVLSETAKFVDSVRNLGYITPTLYLDFTRKIANTNNLYEIKMEKCHINYDPLYSDPAISTSFQGKINVDYKATYDDEIKNTIFFSTDNMYKFSRGDYFSVLVYNKNKTFATKIQEIFYMTPLATQRIVVNYGGVVRDESN